jgi:hypothetical protein
MSDDIKKRLRRTVTEQDTEGEKYEVLFNLDGPDAADHIEELEAKLAKAKGVLEREIQRVQEIQSVFPPPHKVGLVYVEEEYRRMLVEMMGDTDG